MIQPALMKVSDAAKLMERSDAEYMPEITVSAEIIEKYMTGDSLDFLNNQIGAAALMGVYVADVVYHGAFRNKHAAFDSYTAGQLIANEIGIGDVFVENFISRHESDTFKPDQMLREIDIAISKFNEEFSSTDRARILIAFLAGNYVEKLYQVHATIQNYKARDLEDEERLLLSREFVLIALSQEKALNTLISLIEKNSYEEDPGLFFNKLMEISKTMENITPLRDQMNELSPDQVFANEDFDTIFAQFSDIRTIITNQVEQ